MKATKVYLLEGGSLAIPKAAAFDDATLSGIHRIPVFSVLIDHEEGLFLYDSGFDLNHALTQAAHTMPSQLPTQTIPAQLRRLGWRPDQVTHVVNSHFHFDHCGGNRHCPQATTICHALELDAINSATPQRGYSDRSCVACWPRKAGGADTLSIARMETLSGDNEIARGIHLVETSGHTKGHYSLLVVLARQTPILFTGDACYAQVNFDRERLQSGNQDPGRAHASLMHLKALAASHAANVIFPHDPDNWGRYLKAPAYYS